MSRGLGSVSLRALVLFGGASWVWWPGPVGGYGRGFGYGGGYYRPSGLRVRFILRIRRWVGVGVGFGSFGCLPMGRVTRSDVVRRPLRRTL